MPTKLSTVMNYNEGLLPIKSQDPLITCLDRPRDKLKSLYFHYDSAHGYQAWYDSDLLKLFHDGGLYHIQSGPLNFRANPWTGLYMIRTSVLKKLRGF